MAHLNILSICLLVATVASGNCFFSNLMNEPLNFAVSLLDGQGKARPSLRATAEPFTTSNPNSGEHHTMTFTPPDDSAVTFSDSHGHSKRIMMAKKYIRNSLKSKAMSPRVEALDSSGDSSRSGEVLIINSTKPWKKSRGYKPLILASPMKSLKLSGHSDHRHVIHASPMKAGHKHRGSMKHSWLGGSAEKLPKVKATIKPQKKFSSGSSELYIRSGDSAEFIKAPSSEDYMNMRESSSSEEYVRPSVKPYPKASHFRSNFRSYSNSVAGRFGNKMKSVQARKSSRHCHICHG